MELKALREEFILRLMLIAERRMEPRRWGRMTAMNWKQPETCEWLGIRFGRTSAIAAIGHGSVE
jgi:hypothetical protein